MIFFQNNIPRLQPLTMQEVLTNELHTEEFAEAKKLGFKRLVIAYCKKFAGKKEKRPPRYFKAPTLNTNIDLSKIFELYKL